MNHSCGSCKYCDFDERYVYPFKCLKKKERYDADELDKRIKDSYKCKHFVFGFAERRTDEIDYRKE